jgi:integrase
VTCLFEIYAHIFGHKIEFVTARTKTGNMADDIANFCTDLGFQGKSDSTAKNRFSDLRHFLKWLERTQQRTPTEIKHLLALFGPYQKAVYRLYPASTANRRMSSLRQYLKWVERKQEDVHTVSPRFQNLRDRRPRLSRQVARPVEKETLPKLINAAKSGHDEQAVAIFQLIGSNGLRASELIGLRWNRVRVTGSRTQIEVVPKVSKTTTTIWLLPEVAESLAALARINRSGPNDEVFNGHSGPFTRRSLETLISKYSQLAGVQRVTAGSLRTACIARWIEDLSSHEIAVVAGEQIADYIRSKGMP